MNDPLATTEGKPIRKALSDAKNGLSTDARCYSCNSIIEVQKGGESGGGPTTFFFRCKCGRSNGKFMGL